MANIIIKLKVMPSSPEVNLEELVKFCKEKIEAAKAFLHKATAEPVAFGLKALFFVFMGPEKELKVDDIEAAIKENPNVVSTEVVDIRRAVD